MKTKEQIEKIIEQCFLEGKSLEETANALNEAPGLASKGFPSIEHVYRAFFASERLNPQLQGKVHKALEEAERLGYRRGTGAAD